MFRQKYDYNFFYNNYKYSHYSMFKRYYRALEERYRYFILLKENINLTGQAKVYRSNLNIDELIDELKDMKFQVVEIHDVWSRFPEPTEYEYSKITDLNGKSHEYLTKIYKNKHSQTKRYYDDELIYMYYSDYSKYVCAARLDHDSIYISYKGYNIVKYFNHKDILVKRTVPLSNPIILRYDTEHKEMVKKVLNKILKDNINGSYNELIESIENEFKIR